MNRRWKVLLLASVGAFLAFLDATIVNIVFPEIYRSFRSDSLSTLSWVLSAYNIVFAALLIPVGRIADLVGRRRVFLGGLVVFAIGSSLCAIAPSASALIGARVLQAVGAALIVPSSVAFLLAEFPIGQRAMAVGLWSGVAGIAAAIGPSLGGLLISVGSWRLVFLVNVPVGILAGVIGASVLSETREARHSGLPDLWGVLIVTAAIGALALAIVEGPQWGWSSVQIVVAFAAAGVLMPLFVWRCSRHRSPVLDLSLFRLRSLSVGNAGTLIFSAGFYGMLLCHVLFLTTVWGYTVLDAGLAMSVAPLVAGAVAGLSGRATDRFGPRSLAIPGALAFAAGNLWFVVRVGSTAHFLTQWLPGAALCGVGVGLAYPALGSAAVAELPPERFATGSSLNAVFRQVGGVIGISVIVAIIQAAGPRAGLAPFVSGWRFAMSMGLTAFAASLGLGRVTEQSKQAAHSTAQTFRSAFH